MQLGNIIKLRENLSSFESFKNFKKDVVVLVTDYAQGRGFGFMILETGEKCSEAGFPKHTVIGNATNVKITETAWYSSIQNINDLEYKYFDEEFEINDNVMHVETKRKGIIKEINENTAEVLFDTQTITLTCDITNIQKI